MKKIIISGIILFFVLSVYGQASTKPSGSGEQQDPYRISNLDELYWIAQDSERWSAHYIQIADIDAGSTEKWFYGDQSGIYEGWKPIGNPDIMFTGSYNGQGHKIDKLYINRPKEDNIGLFGYISNPASIINTGLTSADITGHYFVGGLVGRARSCPLISRCYTSGKIKGIYAAGGLAGYVSYTHFAECCSDCEVSSVYDAGGLAGEMLSSSINNSYFTGKVISSEGGAGGLCGTSDGSIISNSYSAGEINANKSSSGISGSEYLTDISSSYWDREASGLKDLRNGNSRSKEEMTYPYGENTYQDWDFITMWTADSEGINGGYPYIVYSQKGTATFILSREGKGEGINEAQIDISGASGEPAGTFYTDNDGRAVVSLPYGQYKYRISSLCNENITEKAFNIPSDKDIVHAVKSNLYKVVIGIDNADNYPVPGFIIRIWDNHNPDTDTAEKDTDESGKAEFNLPCGRYAFGIFDYYDCREAFRDEFEVKGSDVSFSINMTPQDFDVIFSLDDDGRSAVNGAKIVIFDVDYDDIPLHVLYSSGGSAKATLTCGEYRYEITHKFYETVTGDIKVGDLKKPLGKNEVTMGRKQKKPYRVRHSMVLNSAGREAVEEGKGAEDSIPRERRDTQETGRGSQEHQDSGQTADITRDPDSRDEDWDSYRNDYRDQRDVSDLRPETGSYTGSR